MHKILQQSILALLRVTERTITTVVNKSIYSFALNESFIIPGPAGQFL